MGVIEFVTGFVFAKRFMVNGCREIQYQPCNSKGDLQWKILLDV
jgi:hypothetical protein